MKTATQKTGNDLEVERIMALSAWELLEYVLSNTYYLSDSYYACFARAVHARFDQLALERSVGH
jgi:hypothetical protein